MKMENISKEFNTVKEYVGSQKSLNDDLIAQGIKLNQENKYFEGKIGDFHKKLK